MHTFILSINVDVRKLGYGLHLEDCNSLCFRVKKKVSKVQLEKLRYDLYAGKYMCMKIK